MTSILPGSTLGILGGGQLGRMVTLAARTLGYHVVVLDPDAHCAAGAVADRVIAARFDDVDAAVELARACDVVTVEIEKIGIPSLEAAARVVPVRPGAHVLHMVQDRARQKDWLRSNGFPVGPYWTVHTAAELAAAAELAGPDAFVKSTTGGYDGRGQVRLARPAQADDVWRALGGRPCVVERALPLEREISVLVARRPAGQTVVYPPAWNHHHEGVLDWSVIPAPIDSDVAARAAAIGTGIAESLDVVGLLVTEMFVLGDGTITVNELAPRPHNSFHHTELTVITSQFEQAVRAVCDLPLGAPDVVRPAAIANLFGDLWTAGAAPRWDAALALPGVRVHLYGKSPRPGRKMGHLGAVGDTPDAAVALAVEARRRLRDATRAANGAAPAA
ncbi:MAG TPA: 5-(carboxyamino)imidazole ribonucleotide synthase [Gemmatimonadaceae bacterium]